MKRTVLVFVVVVVIAVVGSASILLLKPEKKNYAVLIDEALAKADAESLAATKAMEFGRFSEARSRVLSSKSHIDVAYRYFKEGEKTFAEAEMVKYKTILELYGTSHDLSMKILNWIEAWAELEQKENEIIDKEDALSVLPEMEIFAESSRELARGLGKLLGKTEIAVKANPAVKEWFDLRVKRWDLGINTMEEYIARLEESIDLLEHVANEIEKSIQELITAFALDYIPIEERVIPTVEIPPISEEIIPSDMAAFFNEFDTDGNGKIDLGEAEKFYYWVKANITYRYDDEDAPDAIPGYPVGDGRPGLEYWQTPYETWLEKAGDCEDMSILHVAFYNHFGISSYVATVSTKPNGELDHAICIVRIGGSPEEFANFLGELVYYELEDGYYMLVDSAYSDVFGYLHQGLGKGEFEMKPYYNDKAIFTLEEAFEMHKDLRKI